MPDTTWEVDPLTHGVDVAMGPHVVTHQLAGIGARVFAGLIDLVIKVPVSAGIAGLLIWASPELAHGWGLGLVLLVLTVFNIGFSVVSEVLFAGQTPGKNACLLRVVAESGEPATFEQLFLRNILRVFDFLPLFYVAAFVSMLVGPKCQRIGDRVACTVVMYEVRLSELLEDAQVPQSIYSTSDDGYLLEAFMVRSGELSDDVRIPLSRQLAQYFHRKYPPVERSLLDTFERGDYLEYLQELYLAEKEVQGGEG